jgi:hypothetical protein
MGRDYHRRSVDDPLFGFAFLDRPDFAGRAVKPFSGSHPCRFGTGDSCMLPSDFRKNCNGFRETGVLHAS